MSKQPSELDCFDKLQTTKDFRGELRWLAELAGAVDSIVDFGCWSAEPFALLWTLNATRVEVVEKEEESLDTPRYVYENLRRFHPECLQGRHIEFHPPQDMITAKLTRDRFDLAYCKRVLTNMQSDQEIQDAVNKMAEVVRPGGWIVAVESMPDKHGNPRPRADLASMFTKAGLREEWLDGAPEDAYCYKKPLEAV
jgi:SAM-dependent methyltransferase